MGDVYHTTNCNWLPANNFLFQIANVLLVFSYFVPDNLNGLFLLRFFLGTAGLFFALWGWMILCAPDTFGWNVLFMIGNYVHALYLFIHIKRPRKFSEQCELVYEKLFEPLGVQRFQFQKLVKICTINDLKHGEYYGRTGFLADRVSILLKGRYNDQYYFSVIVFRIKDFVFVLHRHYPVLAEQVMFGFKTRAYSATHFMLQSIMQAILEVALLLFKDKLHSLK